MSYYITLFKRKDREASSTHSLSASTSTHFVRLRVLGPRVQVRGRVPVPDVRVKVYEHRPTGFSTYIGPRRPCQWFNYYFQFS